MHGDFVQAFKFNGLNNFLLLLVSCTLRKELKPSASTITSTTTPTSKITIRRAITSQVRHSDQLWELRWPKAVVVDVRVIADVEVDGIFPLVIERDANWNKLTPRHDDGFIGMIDSSIPEWSTAAAIGLSSPGLAGL